MGKALSFILASAAVGALAVPRSGNILDDVGLVVSFLGIAMLAWAAAFVTAVQRAARKSGDWRVVVRLLLFVWLPVLPPLAYGISGLRDLVARWSRAKHAPAFPATGHTMLASTLPLVDRLPVASDEDEREPVGAGARTGARA
jgi:hypothetical protein